MRAGSSIRTLAVLLVMTLLTVPRLSSAGLLCRKACGCTCRIDAGRRGCSARERRVATRHCRQGCNLLVKLCGSICAVGVGYAALECRDSGITDGFCDYDLDEVGCY
jgi:hypothetical protein